MTYSRPGVLAVRAINQYRRRDVIPYLALRYYLDSSASRRDAWARRAATHLVATRSEHPYHLSLHFKEITGNGEPRYRELLLPSANESMAEAALLDECSRHSEFQNLPCTFSYRLAGEADRSGMFQPYFKGFQERHAAIANACDDCSAGCVRYVDIKRFYPSISKSVAMSTWQAATTRTGLDSDFQSLGYRLLEGYSEILKENGGVATGPMFSHLIGNLVLRSVDAHFRAIGFFGYFRYVDDIVLVGSREEVEGAYQDLRRLLQDIGLELHDEHSDKTVEVSVREWLEGRNDFRNVRGRYSWPALLGDLKRYILRKEGDASELQRLLLDAGLRLPVRDYRGAVHEASFAERFLALFDQSWFRHKIGRLSARELVDRAKALGQRYRRNFESLIEEVAGAEGFARKRRIPRLRYYASRLAYLMPEDELSAVVTLAQQVPELHLLSCVMSALQTSRVESVLSLGANACQAVAQVMRATGQTATIDQNGVVRHNGGGAGLLALSQGVAIFRLNGVRTQFRGLESFESDELVRFAEQGCDAVLARSTDAFVREAACLHGHAANARHAHMLDTAFDEDEEMSLDVIDQLHLYFYDMAVS